MASTGEPKSPTLEELPKISADLKQEVTKDHPLKHVEVHEKNVLPTEEGKHSGKEKKSGVHGKCEVSYGPWNISLH
jgi:hypothetical protein